MFLPNVCHKKAMKIIKFRLLPDYNKLQAKDPLNPRVLAGNKANSKAKLASYRKRPICLAKQRKHMQYVISVMPKEGGHDAYCLKKYGITYGEIRSLSRDTKSVEKIYLPRVRPNVGVRRK